MSVVFYAVIAPKWRAWFRPLPALGTRPLLRWQVVRETRPVVHGDGIVSSGCEHVSFHWTLCAAQRAAAACRRLPRPDRSTD